jgi:hypothetical protein
LANTWLIAGRKTGTNTAAGHDPSPLSIRTSRYFRCDDDTRRWQQFHHHGGRQISVRATDDGMNLSGLSHRDDAALPSPTALMTLQPAQ